MTTVDITVPDMACGACADAITQAVHTLDQTATVQADTGTKRVIIQTTAAAPTGHRRHHRSGLHRSVVTPGNLSSG
jgi:copper chaperone